MSTHLRTFIWKVFLLSTVLGSIFALSSQFYVNGFFNLKSTQPTIQTENLKVFAKLNNSNLWSISVAITTNIGTSHKLITQLPASIYRDVMSIEEAMYNRKTANDEIIWKNMIATTEYANVLKTSVKNLIGNSLNKKDVLDAYISQLEFRYENAVNNQKNLVKQKELFISAMTISNTDINNIKNKIQADFIADDSEASLGNIDNFLKVKNEYYFAKTYVVYINQFLWEYQRLNAYNKNLLDVLINNKEAILKDTYLIIPNNGWLEALKSLDLIFEEADFKNNK
jgi:hypothetical protein